MKLANFKNIKSLLEIAETQSNKFPVNLSVQIKSVVENVNSNKTKRLDITFQDCTGTVNAKQFTSKDDEIIKYKKIYTPGSVFFISGEYTPQFSSITIDNVTKIDTFEIKNFNNSKIIDSKPLISFIKSSIGSINDDNFKSILVKLFKEKQEIRSAFFEVPASVGYHHSYKHGLLQHTVSMLELLNVLLKNYNVTDINIDLAITGCILHDIGKVYSFAINNGVAYYATEQNLFGHISDGQKILQELIDEIKTIPQEIQDSLRHIILSHHGKQEWGSPVKPVTREAILIHQLDLLDANFSD